MSVELERVLAEVANQIFAVAAPDTARMVTAKVTISDAADTAGTDGVEIRMPTQFCNVVLADNATVAVGLLTHEIGHFLQPLEELERVEQTCGAPRWLTNLSADIQLEALMAQLFPALAEALMAVRRTVRTASLTKFEQQATRAGTFAEGAAAVLLWCRFCEPRRPVWLPGSAYWLPAAWSNRAWEFMRDMQEPAEMAAAQLPKFLKDMLRKYPELKKQAPPDWLKQLLGQLGSLQGQPDGQPLRAPGQSNALGQVLSQEATGNTANHAPQRGMTLGERVGFQRQATESQAAHLARGLRMHFQTSKGAFEIAAPGRLDRRAAAAGDVLPLRMVIPGQDAPRPQVVIAVDESGSMRGKKFERAMIAAQAMALAVRDVGGSVVGITFDDHAWVAAEGDDRLLFGDVRAPVGGGTNFEWLIDAWRRWPRHVVLLVTDGDGSIPPALPNDRRQTCVILIPPKTDAEAMKQIAGQVIILDDTSRLPQVMALLTPQTR